MDIPLSALQPMQLSSGFYQNFLDNKVPADFQPVLQIISFCPNQANNCWVVELSDGTCSFIARGISEALHEQLVSGSFAQRNGIIRVSRWRRALTRNGNVCMQLFDFTVVLSISPIIGSEHLAVQAQRRSPSPLGTQFTQMQTDEFFDGQMKLKLEKVSEMKVDQRCIYKTVIGQFNWELAAAKRAVFGEEKAPSLVVGLYCNEQDRRVDGWTCVVRIKLVVSGERQSSRPHCFDSVRYPTNVPMELPLHWDKLVKDYLGDNDSLDICATVTILQQSGYGSLMQLDTVLNIQGYPWNVNKHHLAAYSPYFRTLFFSKNFGANAVEERFDFEINDPSDDIEAFRMMLAISNPVENYMKPTDSKIDEILRLSDKYDLRIVTERCEKFLTTDSKKPLLQKLALAERYNLFSLRTFCLEKVSPADFCSELRQNISVYNGLSEGLKAKLEEILGRISTETAKETDGQHFYKRARLQLVPPPPPPHANNILVSQTQQHQGRLPPFRFK